MKKALTVFLSITMVFLSGCEKSVSDYFSEVSSRLEQIIITIAEEDVIEEESIVLISPDNESYGSTNLSAYQKLSTNQKSLYSIMYKAIKDMELNLIDISRYSSSNIFSEALIAHRAIMCDCPEFFWMPKTLSVVSTQSSNKTYLCFKDYKNKNDRVGFYGITREQKDEMAKKLEIAEKDIIEGINECYTTFDTELFIHDYLCNNIVYDTESAEDLDNADSDSMTIYGALVKGKAICEGYSKAMQYLCKKSGISCNVVYGEHEGTPHMWNIINPGDGPYYLDVTFDDGSQFSVLHYYFNLTKSEIEKDHEFSEPFSQSKTYDVDDDFNFFCENSNNKAFNYFEYNKAYITDDYSDAVNFLIIQNSEGKTNAELKNLTGDENSKAISVLKSKLRWQMNLKHFYEYDDENIIIVMW